MINDNNVFLLDSLERYDMIDQVFCKSCDWFGVKKETVGVLPSIFSSWVKKFADSNGYILYHTSFSEEDSTREIVGFLMTYIRDAENGRHIWLTATDPEQYRKGIMRTLFRALEAKYIDELRSSDCRVGKLTVNTYPAKFPHMPLFLASQGYDLVAIKEDHTGTKHSFQKLMSIS